MRLPPENANGRKQAVYNKDLPEHHGILLIDFQLWGQEFRIYLHDFHVAFRFKGNLTDVHHARMDIRFGPVRMKYNA